MEQRRRLFAASFTTLVVAGVGFAIRGAILADWAIQFGFTKTELGTITGGGLVGFGVVILAASAIADFRRWQRRQRLGLLGALRRDLHVRHCQRGV